MADMLASACRSQGYSAVWLDPRYPLRLEGPEAILWEGSPDQLDDLQNTHQQYQQAPLVALLDFPRIEDVERAVQLGAAEILAKPTHLEDLFSRLANLVNGQQTLETTQSVA
jgi:DNA-binding NarL/FixJ family response regulator